MNKGNNMRFNNNYKATTFINHILVKNVNTGKEKYFMGALKTELEESRNKDLTISKIWAKGCDSKEQSMQYEIHGRYITDENRKVVCELFADSTGKQEIKDCQPMAKIILEALNN